MDNILDFLRERRQRLLEGKINCIPLPFKRLGEYFPGFEKRRYIIYTANQKIGKSKLVDKMCVYSSFFYAMEHPEELRLKIIYFTLEMGAKEKLLEFYSHLLFKLDGIRHSPTDLKSTNKDYPISEEVLDLLASERYQYYIKAFKECVTYIDDIKNPTGINKFCRDFALKRGHLNYVEYEAINDDTGKTEIRTRIDPLNPYTSNDPEEVVMVILDNYSNLTLESGMNKMQNIEKMSKYFITLRDQFDFSIHAVQHQAQAQEGLENLKLNKLEPSSEGLADCKTTTRDVNMVIGLFNPYKFELPEYKKYDITKFENYIRFMKILEDRDNGTGGMICPLLFDGAVSDFAELPPPDDTRALQNIYNYLHSIRQPRKKATLLLFLSTTVKNMTKKWQK